MPNDVVSRAIDAVCAGETLPPARPSPGLAEIREGRPEPIQTGAFLIALRAKGETVSELVGLARTMRSLAAPVHANRSDLVDTAGTGGGPSTFNVSTTAALVAAGAGGAVAKHGNRSGAPKSGSHAGAGCAVAKQGTRSATSKSGSSDVLEALAVAIDLGPEAVARCIDEVGFGFLFAPPPPAATAHLRP